MKKMQLILSIRVEVDTKLSGLSDTVQELEQQTDYHIGSTDNVTVLDTEILKTPPINPNP